MLSSKPLLRSSLLLIDGLSPYRITAALSFESKLSSECSAVILHGSMLEQHPCGAIDSVIISECSQRINHIPAAVKRRSLKGGPNIIKQYIPRL